MSSTTQYIVNGDKLTTIAQAIRTKTGSTNTYTMSQMASAILNISSSSAQAVPVSLSATKTTIAYVEGQQIDTSDITVQVHYSDGTTATLANNAATYSVADGSTGTKVITISYLGLTTSISVVVSSPEEEPIQTDPTLVSITATKTQTVYNVGEVLSLADITVTAHYSNETTQVLSNSACTITIVDDANLNDTQKMILVEYSNLSTVIRITVPANVPVTPTLVYITASKTVTEYEEGDTIGTDDITVTGHYTDGSTSAIDLDDCEITMLNVAGGKIIVIEYGDFDCITEVTIDIDVPTLNYITASKTTTTYKQGATIATNDISLTGHYSDGSTQALTGFATEVIDATAPHKVVTVTYSYYTIAIPITVAPTVASITFTKASMNVDQYTELSLSDITVTATYSDNTTATIPATDVTFAPFSTQTVGTFSLTGTYFGKSYTLEGIHVRSGAPTRMYLISKTKTTYYVGEPINVDDITVQVLINNVEHNLTQATADGETHQYDHDIVVFPTNQVGTEPGTKTIRVYATDAIENSSVHVGVDVDLTIVANNITGITATMPITSYNSADEIDMSTLVITATKNYGTEVIPNANASISVTTIGETHNRLVSVAYQGKTATLILTCANAGIESITASKTISRFRVGDTVSTDDITIHVLLDDGNTVNVTSGFTVTTPFNTTTTGTRTVTVSYHGKSTTITYKVFAKCSSSFISSEPRVEFIRKTFIWGVHYPEYENDTRSNVMVFEDYTKGQRDSYNRNSMYRNGKYVTPACLEDIDKDDETFKPIGNLPDIITNSPEVINENTLPMITAYTPPGTYDGFIVIDGRQFNVEYTVVLWDNEAPVDVELPYLSALDGTISDLSDMLADGLQNKFTVPYANYGVSTNDDSMTEININDEIMATNFFKITAHYPNNVDVDISDIIFRFAVATHDSTPTYYDILQGIINSDDVSTWTNLEDKYDKDFMLGCHIGSPDNSTSYYESDGKFQTPLLYGVDDYTEQHTLYSIEYARYENEERLEPDYDIFTSKYSGNSSVIVCENVRLHLRVQLEDKPTFPIEMCKPCYYPIGDTEVPCSINEYARDNVLLQKTDTNTAWLICGHLVNIASQATLTGYFEGVPSSILEGGTFEFKITQKDGSSSSTEDSRGHTPSEYSYENQWDGTHWCKILYTEDNWQTYKVLWKADTIPSTGVTIRFDDINVVGYNMADAVKCDEGQLADFYEDYDFVD